MAIDLRSDTLTKPTQAMRAAMAAAVLGDDVYGEDPEVNELQATAARLLGKEAGLFVPSGTMGNLLAMMAHCHSRGMEVLLGDESHIYNYEAGGAASVGGLVFHVIPTADNGQLPLPTLQKALRNRPNDPHCPKPGVLCLENTHNRCGGAVLPLDYMANVAEWAAMHNLPIHLDGARVFNAAVALGVPVSDIAQHVTTVSFCLSKGLCCPVGSVLVGPRDVIRRAHRLRKMLGGGLRQAGVLAAPGLLALRDMVARLADDHAQAAAFARHVHAHAPGIVVDLDAVQSNIVVLHLEGQSHAASVAEDATATKAYAAAAGDEDALTGAVIDQGDLSRPPATPAELVARMRARGVLVSCFRDGVRVVTHADVAGEQVSTAARVLCDIMCCR